MKTLQRQPKQSPSRRAFLQGGITTLGLATLNANVFAQNLVVKPANTSNLIPSNFSTHVNQMGLGCMGMSEFYGAINQTAVDRTLSSAYDYGITLYDTADMYGNGHNEQLLAEFARGKRDKINIATKFGIVREGNNVRIDNHPNYIRQCCEDSLRRLKTDYIDTFYIHRINPTQPIEETMQTMAALQQEGKIKAIGLSEASITTIQRAHAIAPVAAVETEYSLFSREPEQDIMPLCAQLNISFVPYAPLCRGLLTGTALPAGNLSDADFRKGLPRFQRQNFERNMRLVSRLTTLAEQYGYTAAQLSLAWMLSKNPNVVPIPGMRSVKHLSDNLAAINLKLAPEEILQIDRLFPLEVAAGRRYTDEELTTVNL